MKDTQKSRKVGFCIYCGSKDSLSDEHIIPFALSGKFTLNVASCENCRKITNSLEAPVLRGIFYDYRYYKGLQSRTKFKDYEPVREYLVKTKDGKKEKRELHLNQVGMYFLLPEFEEPKFLTGDKGKGVRLRRVVKFSAKPKPHNPLPDISEVKIERKIPTSHLVKLLCKIGLGYAYLQSKDAGLESFVTELILGETGVEDWKYVGSPSNSRFKDSESGVQLFEKDGLLLAEIKLFEDVLARYLVVLGKI